MVKMSELEKEIHKTIGKFYNDFQLTYSEEVFIDQIIENITSGHAPNYGFKNLTATEELVILKVMDYLNRRIKVEL